MLICGRFGAFSSTTTARKLARVGGQNTSERLMDMPTSKFQLDINNKNMIILIKYTLWGSKQTLVSPQESKVIQRNFIMYIKIKFNSLEHQNIDALCKCLNSN